MDSFNDVQRLAVMILPVLLAITVHEAAHGYVAKLLGDRTAELLGRVTLNPFKHIDPVGTVLVPLGIFFLSSLGGGVGFLFGWAKPVPINGRNLRDPRRGMALVAIAGPGANLLMAILWGMGLKLGIVLDDSSDWVALPLQLMGLFGVLINVWLMVLNLFPLLPLDGGRVLTALLPRRWAVGFTRLEPYGMVILLGLLVTGLLGRLLLPLVILTISLLPGGYAVVETFFY